MVAIVIRTRYFDDFPGRITNQEGIGQVVLMAAGLDARAFRLAWVKETRLYELDQPSVLTYKDQLLRSGGQHPRYEQQTIGVDLTTSWTEALIKSGFDPHRRIINGAMLTSALTRTWVEMQADAGAPWIGTMDDPVAFLGQRGWQARLTQAGAEDANYGRWPFPVIPTTMPDMPHNWHVTAQKVI